jgi:hypothetical protein
MADHDSVFNIGPAERRKRAIVGVVGFGVAIAIVRWLRIEAVNPAWRLAAFPFLLVGSLGLLQAREKT